MKERLIAGLPILLLLIACVRLGVSIDDERRRLKSAHALAVSMPKTGSLRGIGPRGLFDPAQPDYRFRVLFVIHLSSVTEEVRYWNATRRAVGQASIDWWGICDSGRSCDAFQPAAQFSIIGFMDPYQMRVVANADAGARAVLYEGNSLRGAIGRAAEPAGAAEAIMRLLQ